MVPPVARLGTRWASRSTAPARGKQPGLSQGGPRRSQNRSPPAVTPLCWGGRALRAQCGFALAPPEAGKGPRRAFANSPERYSPGGDPFAMCLRLRPGRSRGARRVWRRGARLPRGGTAQTRQRITCKYRSASRLGANLPVINLSLSTVEWALSNGQSVTIIRGDSPKIAPKKAREARRRDSTAARPLAEPKRLLELHCTSRSVEAARVRPFAPAIG